VSSWKWQGRTGEILGTDVQGELRAQAADVGVALLPKKRSGSVALWHSFLTCSFVGFSEFPLHVEASQLLKIRHKEVARKEWPVR